MKIVIEIPDKKYEALKMLGSATIGLRLGVVEKAIINGTPLPEGAEILTAEAYSDLCLRASQGRKTGKWIPVGKSRGLIPSDDFKCSVCGNFLDFQGVNAGRGDANYCPHCGAKMEGAEDGRSC